MDFFFTAFMDLTSERYDAGAPIRWGAIQNWTEVHGPMDDEQVDDVFYFVRAMDDAYRKYYASKAKKEAERRGSRGKHRGGGFANKRK